MDLPVQKKENTNTEMTEPSMPDTPPPEPIAPVPAADVPTPMADSPVPVEDVPVEPSVTEEQTASAILDAQEQELPPVPVVAPVSEISPIVKTRTKRCPKGCVKKSRCKGSIKGGKKRKSRKSKRKNKRRKSRKSRKN
jgi:hypothetical protein